MDKISRMIEKTFNNGFYLHADNSALVLIIILFLLTVDGVWQPWSEWEECNVTCGGGSHSRYRTCIQPQFGGAPCNGSDIDTRECNTHFCPGNICILYLFLSMAAFNL